jgi:hypothetical protein
MKKRYIAIILLIVTLVITYFYVHKEHRKIEEETAVFIITSEQIDRDFIQNSLNAEAKYLNQTIEISGLVSEVNHNNITLDGQIFCQFNNNIENPPGINSEIKIKGRFIGYDDLLEEIKLDQCIITN